MASRGPTVLYDGAVPDLVQLLKRRKGLDCIALAEVLRTAITWSA